MAEKYQKLADAAKLANTSPKYLHKLKDAGELDAYYEQKGNLKY